MKIIILGAGRVGASVAESLVSEQNDITVVDTDPAALADLQAHLDLRTTTGNGIQPSVLKAAGIEDADMLISVTSMDETNLVASQVAKRMFQVPTTIARVRSELQDHPKLTGEDGFGVDHMLMPEHSITQIIRKLIEFPEALQVLEFADGKVSLIAVRAYEGGPLVARPIRELRQHMPTIDSRIVAIFRRGNSVIPDGDTLIEPGDEVFFLAATENIRAIMAELRRMDKPVRRILIAGGGRVGLRLARALVGQYSIKMIEANKRRCEYLAAELPDALILHGDATDEDVLNDEGVADTDLFIALTADDENNIMSSLLAKRMGARRTIALINRKAYAELMEGSRIDVAIVPALSTLGDLLTHVRRGDVTRVHSLRRGAAEALEAIAHGDSKSSKLIGRRIEQVTLPKGARIGALVRSFPDGTSQVLMAHHDVEIESEDHIIVFVENKSMLPQVEKLFQVGVGFF